MTPRQLWWFCSKLIAGRELVWRLVAVLRRGSGRGCCLKAAWGRCCAPVASISRGWGWRGLEAASCWRLIPVALWSRCRKTPNSSNMYALFRSDSVESIKRRMCKRYHMLEKHMPVVNLQRHGKRAICCRRACHITAEWLQHWTPCTHSVVRADRWRRRMPAAHRARRRRHPPHP